MQISSIYAVLVVVALSTAAAFVPPEYPSMESLILVVIKPTSEVEGLATAGGLTTTQINTYAERFVNVLPKMIYDMTRGVVRYNTELVISPYPLKRITELSKADPSKNQDAGYMIQVVPLKFGFFPSSDESFDRSLTLKKT